MSKEKQSALERYKAKKAQQEVEETPKKITPKEAEVLKKKVKKKIAEKKVKSKSEKAIGKAVRENPNASSSSLVEKLRGKLTSLQGKGGSGGQFNFIKMERGSNTFRVVEPTSGPLLLFYKRHRGESRGNFRTAVDLNWLVSDDDVIEAMMERDRINDKDLQMIQRYGEPYNTLFKGLASAGREKAFSDAGIGQKRCMMVICKDGDFGILDMGIRFGQAIFDLYAANPSIVSWDNGMSITVKASGEGLKRKYSSPIPNMGDTGELEFEIEDDEEPTTPNLYDVLATNVLHYPDKVQFLLNSHKNLLALAALDVEDFGISERELTTSFKYGENEDGEDKDEDITAAFPKRNKTKKIRRIKVEEPEEDEEDLDIEEVEDDEEEIEEEESEEEGDEDEEEEEDDEELEDYDEEEEED